MAIYPSDCMACNISPESVFADGQDLAVLLNPNAPTYFLRFAVVSKEHRTLVEVSSGILGEAVEIADLCMGAAARSADALGVTEPYGWRMFMKNTCAHFNLDFIPLYSGSTDIDGIVFPNSSGSTADGREIFLTSAQGLPPLDAGLYGQLTESMRRSYNAEVQARKV